MKPTNSPPIHLDQDAERRRVLAKIYSLLIRLAEETDRLTAHPDAVISEEEVAEPTPVQLVLLD